ncbi:hypothetical protein BKP37_12865 [Anaerobacillus alkalilacustris]|uniref:Replication protein n=1 Tax=Anaerobacillus alkalilacustris TaxID=393763 RepID=A0A1S2LLX4_9BACI|nr:hypothetical protein [Anaerobacillus alkalilacustris]OIJ12687.1 hypothetical protein BKP37_12865 [Anaerobacillus alkalilacustris]
MTTNYLLDEYPLLVLPSLATSIGLNKAIVLQQAHYWLNKSTHNREGIRWFYKTYSEWKVEFPFWSDRTIRRTISDLEKDKLLVTANFNKMKADHTKWYTINYQILKNLMTKPCGQNDQAMWSSCPDGVANMTKAIPDITTDINDYEDDKENKVNLEKKSQNQMRENAIQQLEQCYLQRRGSGLIISPSDIQAIVEVIDQGINLQDAMNWTNEVFDNFKPKHSHDRINSFNYIAQYIFTKQYEKTERAKALAGGGQSGGTRGNSTKTISKVSKIKTENGITPKQQNQRLVGENGEIQDTECDY